MIKILGIAPYPGLRDLLMEMAERDGEIELDVEIADLHEALPIVQRAEERGYNVIVSRGGTASFIRRWTRLPVVDIPVSGYDMLRVLTLIRDSHSRLAIIGFPNICEGAATVSSLLDFEIPIYSIERETEVPKALETAFHNGAQMVLGDVVTVRTAQQMGRAGILITSGPESVQAALAEAKQVYEAYRRGQERGRLYRAILEEAPQGIFVVLPNGEIGYANRVVEDILGTQTRRTGTLLSDFSMELDRLSREAFNSRRPIRRRQVVVGERLCRVEVIPHFNGKETECFIYFEPTTTVQGTKAAARAKSRVATFARIVGSSQVIQQAISKAKEWAKTDKHVWITGEPGSGRSLFAQAIHAESRRADHPFWSLNCGDMERPELEQQLFGTDGEPGLLQMAAGGTLHLQDIDRLHAETQKKLVAVLRAGSPVRVIATSVVSWGDLLRSGEFRQDLALLLAECHLRIPPLRQRPEDIREIAKIAIADHNSQYGKQIVGIRQEVLERLQRYDWPGNVAELLRVLEEMLLLTHGHYVGEDQADAVLERYASVESATDKRTVEIDLTGTWDEIERQVLLHVLKEEGMNQSKAARRLGINRSTLWRKLRGSDAK